MTTVAVIVVRWKGGDEVERCLRALGNATMPLDIVLVDAGSGDGGAEFLAGAFPKIRVEALPDNPGFAGASNHGVKITDTKYVFLLNPDTEVLNAAPQILAEYLEKRPNLAGAVPLLEDADGAGQHRWQLKKIPTPWDLSIGRSGRPAFSRPPTKVAKVAQPAAAAWMIRRAAWNSLDGLDPAFFPAWWEDVDFCARLDEKIKDPSCTCNETWHVVPEARVRHIGGSSVSSLGNRAFLEAFYGNLLRFAERHHPQELPAIRRRLRLVLTVKGLLRPSRFGDYREVMRTLE